MLPLSYGAVMMLEEKRRWVLRDEISHCVRNDRGETLAPVASPTIYEIASASSKPDGIIFVLVVQ
jgi:hypothetical protein